MSKFTFGIDFGNKGLIDGLIDIIGGVVVSNSLWPYKNNLESVYGAISDKRDIIGGAREANRISGTFADLENTVIALKKFGIATNYVCNSFYLTPNYIESNKSNIVEFFKLLKVIGIDGVIVANPLLIDYIKNENLKVIISTILHVDNLGLLDFYIKKEVDTVVLSLYANRDFGFLEAISKIKSGSEYNIKIELMVNEICLTPCPWRIQHYIQESSGEVCNTYFSKCYAKMKTEFPWSILCSNFIRPEDVDYYCRNYGIDRFKITGRTFNYKKMLNTLCAYLMGEYHGNLLDLFPIVRGIANSENSDEYQPMFISNDGLRDFIAYYPKDIRCDISCFRFGGDCSYCKDFQLFKYKEGL